MANWQCPGCDYIYDQATEGSPPGMDEMIPFEKIPGDWACPKCGVKKTEFKKKEKD